MKDGYAFSIQPNHRKNLSNLDYIKLFVNNIQSIAVNLQTETGRLVPISGGGGKIVLTLKFQKFSDQVMEAYYHKQATMPHFSGHYRQRGSGLGDLAKGIG